MSATSRCDALRELVWTPDGARTPDEETLLQAHLAGCAECRAAVEAARRVAASLAALPTVAAPQGLRERTLAELDARRATAAAVVNGAAPASASPATAPLPSLGALRRRSLPIALRVALPLAATLALAIVWWQSRDALLASTLDAAAPTAREGEEKELLALAPAEKAAKTPEGEPTIASHFEPASEAGDAGAAKTDDVARAPATDPEATGGVPVAAERGDGRVRGVGAPPVAPPGAPPAPGAAAPPEAERVDPRSAALLAAATPADALRLVALERAANYGEAERGLDLDQELRKSTGTKDAPKGPPVEQGTGGGGGGEVRRDGGLAKGAPAKGEAGAAGGAKKHAGLDERDGEEHAAAAPTEVRYAEWTPASPHEQELLAEWSRRGAREGDLLVVDLSPEEFETTRVPQSGFIDFGDDEGRVLRPVEDPERWWKATWRAADVSKLKGELKSGDAKPGDAKSVGAPSPATGAARGKAKPAAKAPAEPKSRVDGDREKADRDDATRHDEEARAAKARRVRVVVRLIGS